MTSADLTRANGALATVIQTPAAQPRGPQAAEARLTVTQAAEGQAAVAQAAGARAAGAQATVAQPHGPHTDPPPDGARPTAPATAAEGRAALARASPADLTARVSDGDGRAKAARPVPDPSAPPAPAATMRAEASPTLRPTDERLPDMLPDRRAEAPQTAAPPPPQALPPPPAAPLPARPDRGPAGDEFSRVARAFSGAGRAETPVAGAAPGEQPLAAPDLRTALPPAAVVMGEAAADPRAAETSVALSRADAGAPGAPAATAPATGAPLPPGPPASPGPAQQLAVSARDLANGPVEITLAPAELGRVTLTLSPGEGGIVVAVLAERSETLELLRRSIGALAQELRDLGYGNPGFTFGEDRRMPTAPGRGYAQPPEPESTPPSGAASGGPALQTATGLDLRI